MSEYSLTSADYVFGFSCRLCLLLQSTFFIFGETAALILQATSTRTHRISTNLRHTHLAHNNKDYTHLRSMSRGIPEPSGRDPGGGFSNRCSSLAELGLGSPRRPFSTRTFLLYRFPFFLSYRHLIRRRNPNSRSFSHQQETGILEESARKAAKRTNEKFDEKEKATFN